MDGFLRGEGFEMYKGGPLPATVLLAVRKPGRIVGFAEIDLRPQADGCVTHPVGHLEGWYVSKKERRREVGRALVNAAEDWARKQGCSEMASDTLLENSVGEKAHRALGYEEVHRTIQFRKNLR
ncbi:MAG: GNAT family N-acetyltransferase [Thermoplasmata archaeon]|nr:GNAT family N-acetyltransferase [Thermoplasmata archaeon]